MGEIPYRAAIRTTSSRVGSPSSMARTPAAGASSSAANALACTSLASVLRPPSVS